MSITPDTKNWTWVLDRECPECRFDASAIAPEDVPTLLHANASAWYALLTAPGPHDVRPNPQTWSPLEYACHVRDCIRLYDYRLHLMLDQEDPLFPDWNQDETAVKERYNEQDPKVVAEELRTSSATLEAGFASVTPAQWHRTGRRSDGAAFTIDTFARYFIHDPIHHLHDVRA